MRVMHMSRGLPLISAEHEPHFPALQFHRTEHDHPLPCGDLILFQLAALARAPEQAQPALLRHGYFPSLMRVMRSAGSAGCVSRRTVMRVPSFFITICSRACLSSESG